MYSFFGCILFVFPFTLNYPAFVTKKMFEKLDKLKDEKQKLNGN